MDAQWTFISLAIVLLFACVIGAVAYVTLRRRDRPEARLQQLRDSLAHFEWLRHALMQKIHTPEYDGVAEQLQAVHKHIEQIHRLLDRAKEEIARVHAILPPT